MYYMVHSGKYTLFLVSIVFMLFGCTAEVKISSRSMSPTIHPGDTVKIDKFYYLNNEPARWDIIAFVSPTDDDHIWFMRIAGMPGDTLIYTDEVLKINGKIMSPPNTKITYQTSPIEKPSYAYEEAFVVPKETYFVLGDNWEKANDSRFWGIVPSSHIKGKVVIE